MLLQMSNANRAGSREKTQAHSSSNAPGLKQVHSLGRAQNSPAGPKPASSQAKAEAQQPDGINSPSTDPKPGSDTAAPVKVQLVNDEAPRPMLATDETACVQVKIQTEDMKCDTRPEPGEISNAACEGGHKRSDLEVLSGTGLTVKLAVRVKRDEAVGGSPVVKPQEPRLRDRCVPCLFCCNSAAQIQRYLTAYPYCCSYWMWIRQAVVCIEAEKQRISITTSAYCCLCIVPDLLHVPGCCMLRPREKQ